MVKSWPHDLPQGMGALAVGSNGTLWAGTGEANPGGGSITFGGNGIYRSTDGGVRWKNMGNRHGSRTGSGSSSRGETASTGSAPPVAVGHAWRAWPEPAAGGSNLVGPRTAGRSST
jgi:hypothetical protein